MCSVGLCSTDIPVIFTYYTSNERESFSLFNVINNFVIINVQKKTQIKKLFFHFYFLNKDISFVIQNKQMRFSTDVKHFHVEGTVPQIFDLGLSFYFISKNGNFL